MYNEDDIPKVTIKGGFQDVDIEPPEDFEHIGLYELMGVPCDKFMRELMDEMGNMINNDIIKNIIKDKNENSASLDEIESSITTNALLFKAIESSENPIISSYKAYTDEDFEKDFKDRYDSPQAVVDDTPYYTNEEVEKYGCVAIYFKKIR